MLGHRQPMSLAGQGGRSARRLQPAANTDEMMATIQILFQFHYIDALKASSAGQADVPAPPDRLEKSDRLEKPDRLEKKAAPTIAPSWMPVTASLAHRASRPRRERIPVAELAGFKANRAPMPRSPMPRAPIPRIRLPGIHCGVAAAAILADMAELAPVMTPR